MNNFKKGSVIVAVLLALALIVTLNCLTKIEAGYAGVVYNTNGGVEDKVLSQGWHINAPWKKITEYPVSTETVYLSADKQEGSPKDDSFYISTKDGKLVNVDIAYSYRMKSDTLPQLFTKFRGKKSELIENGYMRDRLKEACNTVSTGFDVLEVYGEKRQSLNTEVFKRFKDSLNKVGIVVETFSFTRVEPDKASMQAIQSKVDARQALERMKIEKEQTQINAEKQKIKAQGNAEAKIIEAEGTAQSNKLLQQSLTASVIEQKWIDKWDGKLPTYSGSGSNMLVQMPTK